MAEGEDRAEQQPPASVDVKSISVTRSAKPDANQKATGVEPFDPGPAQEKTRGHIAYALLGALFVVVIFLMVAGGFVTDNCLNSTDCVASRNTLQILTAITSLILTPLVGLVGSVVGFYFGSKAAAGKG